MRRRGNIRTLFCFLVYLLDFSIVLVQLSLAALICCDNVIIHTLVEFLNNMVSAVLHQRLVQIHTKSLKAHLELRGNSEFKTQLLIENCSRKSFRR